MTLPVMFTLGSSITSPAISNPSAPREADRQTGRQKESEAALQPEKKTPPLLFLAVNSHLRGTAGS